MTRGSIGGRASGLALGLALLLGGCNAQTGIVGATAGFHGADVDSIVSECGGAGAGRVAPRQGMTQCDLVHSQGRPADAVVADMPDGRRRVELFYPGNGGTTRGYVFVADRLVSTPPGTLKE